MSKILFTDFDETLLSTDKTICEDNRIAINEALSQGHYVAYITGRPLYGALRLVERLDLPREHCFLICFQGCLVYDLQNKKEIVSASMNREETLSLVTKLLDKNIYIEVFGKNGFYCFEETEATKRYTELAKEVYKVIDSVEEIEDEDIYKVMAIDFHNKDALLQLQKEAEADKTFPFESFFSSEWFYEYCGKNQNKGTGVKNLAEYLDVPMENTVAVGDEENDVSMIQTAHIGVAMKNAREEIHQKADFVTTRDNNEGGVAEVIRRFILD